MESATGSVKRGRSVPSQVAEASDDFSESDSSSVSAPRPKITPMVETMTSLAGKEAMAALPIRQSHPSGFTMGSISLPVRPK